MKHIWKPLACAALCATLSAPVFAAGKDVVATVNGQKLLQQDIDNYIMEMRMPPEQAQQQEQILNELISRELVHQQALKKKLDKSPEVLAELESVKKKILLNAAIRDAMEKDPVTEEELKKEYEAQVPNMQQQEFKARHILVESEDEAKKLITALDRGADFSTLANEKSLDGAAQNGGDLGWFPANQMVPPFAEAVQTMKKGSYSKTPVETQFGWHVIALDDARQGEAPALDDIRPQLENYLQQKHIAAYLETLHKDAVIDIKLK